MGKMANRPHFAHIQGPPRPPIATGGPFPQAMALPSPPSPSHFRRPHGSFCNAAQDGMGKGSLTAGGWKARALKAALGARPTFGGTRSTLRPHHFSRQVFQGPVDEGVSNGWASRSGLVLPGFLSGLFLISTCEEQFREGPRHNLDL